MIDVQWTARPEKKVRAYLCAEWAQILLAATNSTILLD